MASIYREVVIEARPDEVWAALRDWGALHRRLAPGFVTDSRLDGEDRIVSFADGLVVREGLGALDDERRRLVWAGGGGLVAAPAEERRRLVWTVVDGPYSHHNGAAQVHAEGSHSRFVWTADLLPQERAAATAQAMEEGLRTIKRTLEGVEPG